MIEDLSGKEKSALLGAAEIALGFMSEEVEAPRVPRPEEQPLSAEETAGFAMGDPFKEHGLPSARHENAAGKKLCGMCSFLNRAKPRIAWHCNKGLPCPWPKPENPCPQNYHPPIDSKPLQFKTKGLPVPEGVKFFYFGRPPGLCLRQDRRGNLYRPGTGSREHEGVVTVAWTTPAPGVLHLGFSFCSPEDPWCKATGRDMALARLLWSDTGPGNPLVIPFLYSPRRTVHEVVRAVLSHDFERLAALTPGATMWERVPSWTRGLGKRMERNEITAMEINIRMGRPKGWRPDPTHAADAFAFMVPFFNPLNPPNPRADRAKPLNGKKIAEGYAALRQKGLARIMADLAALGDD